MARNPGVGKGKNVAFAAPIYFENSGNEWSSEDEEGEEEGEEEDVDEEGSDWEQDGQEGFDDDDETASDEIIALAPAPARPSTETTPSKDDARTSLGRGPSPIQRAQMEQAPPAEPSAPVRQVEPARPLQTQPLHPVKKVIEPFDELVAASSPDGPTKKLTLTPEIAASNFDSASVQVGCPASLERSHADFSYQRSSVSTESGRSYTESSPSLDSHAGSDDTHQSKASKDSGKKLKKERADETGDGKKRKAGGILGGLFSRKKDKKGKKAEGEEADEAEGRRSQDEAARRVSDGEMFSTDAALRQQRVEAQEVLYRQFGIQQRRPGEQTNQVTSRQPTQHADASRPPRPGSLIGSPAIPGLDVPVLNVLRLFVGDQIDSEATFKTVLLNETTSTADLIKQAMQRFHLPSGVQDRARYYLTIKDVSGEERILEETERPLRVFEALNDSLGTAERTALPSIKRSSVGSISSVASDLSLHPAISRLGAGDFGDDSAVKLYINRFAHGAQDKLANHDGDGSDTATLTAPSPRDSLQDLQRFAMRVRIHPADLPESLVFDPSTNAIVPRAAVQGAPVPSAPYREKVMLFPRNVNVSEAIEHALDAFGIPEGVVDGGDDIEDKISKRRSIARVRYALTVRRGEDAARGDDRTADEAVAPNSKVLDAYHTSPALRSVDRTKEMKRRSLDPAFALGTVADVARTDPVFVLRRAPGRLRDSVHGSSLSDELAKVAKAASPNEQVTATRETIAAQRAAYLSAASNAHEGVDITLANRARLRSIRRPSDGRMRYSYVDQGGSETDVSHLVEAEWASQVSLSSFGDEGYASAPESPIQGPRGMVARDDDAEAIETLRATPISIGGSPPKRSSSRGSEASGATKDLLAPALDPVPPGQEAFGKRVDRVVAQIQGQSHPRRASTASAESSRSSGRTSPATPMASPTADGDYTPISSAARHGTESRQSDRRMPIVYKDDFGLDVLMDIVEHSVAEAAAERKRRANPVTALDSLLGPVSYLSRASPGVRGWYADVDGQLAGVEARLDAVLARVVRSDF